MKQVYAEEVNYWQSSQSSPDTWIERAKKEIVRIGGRVLVELSGTDAQGKTAFFLTFRIGEDTYQIRWAVLPSRTGKDKAARIQAATLLYHDVKHKVVMAKFKGVRTSFLEYLLLPNGQVAGEAAGDADGFMQLIPQLMIGSGKE